MHRTPEDLFNIALIPLLPPPRAVFRKFFLGRGRVVDPGKLYRLAMEGVMHPLPHNKKVL